MKILLTGSAGFVGSTLSSILQKQGHEVIGVDLKQDLVSQTSFQIDLRKLSAEDLPAVDLCIHLASLVGGILHNHAEEGQEKYELELLQKILEWDQKKNFRRLIYLSSINVFEKYQGYESGSLKWSNQITPYARAKSLGERFVERSFKEFVIVRPTNLFGKTQTLLLNRQLGSSHVIPELLRKIEENSEIEVWGDGSQIRNFLHVSDLCHFLVLILQEPRQAWFNLRSEIQMSIGELAQALLKFQGREKKLIFRPEFLKYEMQTIELFDIKDVLQLGWRAKVKNIDEGLQF